MRIVLEQKFGQIVCQPATDIQVRMRDYIISHVFNEIAEEDQSDDENEGKSLNTILFIWWSITCLVSLLFTFGNVTSLLLMCCFI